MSTYSKKLFNKWIEFLKECKIDFNAKEESGTITFEKHNRLVGEKLKYFVGVEEGRYCVRARLPFKFDEGYTEKISSYIFESKDMPALAYFTLDYNENEIYCNYGEFSNGDEDGFKVFEIALDSIEEFLHYRYGVLRDLLDIMPRTETIMRLGLCNAKRIDLFIRNYIENKKIEYKLYSNDNLVNDLIVFKVYGIELSLMVDDSDNFMVLEGRVPKYISDLRNVSKVKEYIHRCNQISGYAFFELFESYMPQIYVVCRADRRFSEQNPECSMIGGSEEIIKMIKTFSPGIAEVAEGKGEPKEVFEKYRKKF